MVFLPLLSLQNPNLYLSDIIFLPQFLLFLYVNQIQHVNIYTCIHVYIFFALISSIQFLYPNLFFLGIFDSYFFTMGKCILLALIHKNCVYIDCMYTDCVYTDCVCTDCVYTDCVYTDFVYTDCVYTDCVYTDFVYTDCVYIN